MVLGAFEGVRPHPRPAGRRDLHQAPQDPQRGGVRRLHRGRPAVPQLAPADRPSRRLRARPHHRRLPAGAALRRRPPDRGQAPGAQGPRRAAFHRGHHPRPRGALRADPRAGRAQGDGGELRLRHLGPGADRARGRAVALLRLPGGGEGAERRRHVAGPLLDLPRRLLRARPRRRPPHRGAGAGDRRRLRHQAAHRALPAHARVRRAVRRRSDLGHRVDRRHGRRRPLAGDEVQLPDAADPLQPRAGAGAQPHHLVLAAAAGRLPPLRRQGGDRHQRAAVRERRDHAPHLGRRRRHRLLRLADAGGQADAVLRRPGQPRQVPALRHQRRPRRDQRQAGGAGLGARAGRLPRPRGRRPAVRPDDGLAGGRVRQTP